MKKVLLLTVVMMLGAGLAVAQPGVFGQFNDAGGTACNILDTVAGLKVIYTVHVLTPGATAGEYACPVPACAVGMTYLAWASNTPTAIGNPVVGLPGPIPPAQPPGAAHGYGACIPAPILVGSTSFFAAGASLPCCVYPVIPSLASGFLAMTDCTIPTPVKFPAGGLSNTINGNASCDCTTPVQETTWGAVKSLYNQ